ncbi:DUF2946 domain-containing protein [Frateuria aurantia]
MELFRRGCRAMSGRQAIARGRMQRSGSRRSLVVAWLALLAWLLLNAAPVVSQCLYRADPAATFPGWCDGHSNSTPAQPRASLPGDHSDPVTDGGMLCGYCDLLFHSPLYMVDFVIAALVIGEPLPWPPTEYWTSPPSPSAQHIQPRGPPVPA